MNALYPSKRDLGRMLDTVLLIRNEGSVDRRLCIASRYGAKSNGERAGGRFTNVIFCKEPIWARIFWLVIPELVKTWWPAAIHWEMVIAYTHPS